MKILETTGNVLMAVGLLFFVTVTVSVATGNSLKPQQAQQAATTR